MSIADIFTPKWKLQTPDVRLSTIEEIEDEKILSELAKNDNDQFVRMAAKKKITDAKYLEELEDYNETISIDDIDELTDEKMLSVAATCSESKYIRIAAIRKISDQELLSIL